MYIFEINGVVGYLTFCLKIKKLMTISIYINIRKVFMSIDFHCYGTFLASFYSNIWKVFVNMKGLC